LKRDRPDGIGADNSASPGASGNAGECGGHVTGATRA